MGRYDKKSVLKRLSENWGKEDSAQEVEFSYLEKNFVRMMKKEDWILDDQTWNDLDMNRSFLKMNRTFTNPGQQSLYNLSRILQFDEAELKRRDRIIRFFQMNREEREQIQCRLHYVGKDSMDSAAPLLYKGVPELPKIAAWVYPGLFGLLLSIASIPFIGARAILLIAIFFALNMYIHSTFSKETEQSLPGIRYVARMLVAARDIAKLGYPELDNHYNDFFEKAVDKCGVIIKKNRALSAGAGAGLLDTAGISAYIEILTLSEERAYIRCSRYLTELSPALRMVYRRLGELDAFQSVASFRRGLRYCSKPQFLEKDGVLRAESIGHPGLVSPVCNDITIENKNVVITGSNMSGKSTFLRTLGLNAVLAQTFYMVMAKRYEASMFNIVTSISPEDDLDEGKSYYMAEATALLRMVNIVEDERCSLLLIDEIFRGTNPMERVAGASALLEYLSKHNCLVVVATHDQDITKNIADRYDQYHFEEKVSKDSLEFDYLIKPGPLETPNGIRILDYLGYPEEIVEDALAHVDEMRVKKAEEDRAQGEAE